MNNKHVATTVDAYLAGFAPEIRKRLERIRATIRKAAPGAQEGISYRIPAYRLEGVLIYFAGFERHIGMYPAPRSSVEFRDELAVYAGGKGTVQFPHDQPLPLALIRRIVKYRLADNLAHAAARKSAKAGKPRAKLAPKKVPPKKVAPKKVAPKKVAPKKVAPTKVAPKKVAPKLPGKSAGKKAR